MLETRNGGTSISPGSQLQISEMSENTKLKNWGGPGGGLGPSLHGPVPACWWDGAVVASSSLCGWKKHFLPPSTCSQARAYLLMAIHRPLLSLSIFLEGIRFSGAVTAHFKGKLSCREGTCLHSPGDSRGRITVEMDTLISECHQKYGNRGWSTERSQTQTGALENISKSYKGRTKHARGQLSGF